MINADFKEVADVVNIFPKSVADIEKRAEWAIEKTQKELDKIINLKPEERTFDNTARALDLVQVEFGPVMHSFGILEMISPKEEIRNSCHETIIKMQQFAIDAFVNVDLYKAFKDYIELRKTQSEQEREKLSSEELYYLDETMREFIRDGLNLPPKELEEVKTLEKEISKLALDFDSNVAKDKSKILVDRNELDGLDEHFINNLEKEGDKFVLKCDYPIYFEIRENCKVGNTRKKLNQLFMRRAYPKNLEILNEVIAKRDERAKKLGFKSFAHLDLDSQMVKTPERAEKFIFELAEKAQKKELKEFEVLSKKLPEDVVLNEEGKFYPWDFEYVKSCYKKKHFDVDEREIAKYFPVQKTIDGVFDIYQQFLGLKFVPIEADNLWHEDVKLIKIYDKNTGKLKGYLFLDLYPRDNKYSHACMADIIPCMNRKDLQTGQFRRIPAVIVVIANFPKATKDRPALLKHDDVETFFHEFGHAMHGFLGCTNMASFSGTSVKRDFVEMPSQMFEEWMWDKQMLKKVSCHYETGQSLPEELIDKKIELKKFDKGHFATRQLWLASIALEYFKPGAKKDTEKIKKELHEKFRKTVAFDPDNKFQAAFGHLMGYGAKYYGYLWAKVFALDLFEQIKKEGLLNSQIGSKLVSKVLGKGGSVEPDKLLKDFLGREPNQKAFLKDLGLE